MWQFLAELFIRIKNISDKTFVEKIKTRILSSVFFFLDNQAIMWKNTLKPGRPQMIIWRMRIARWIPKATNTYSEYVILIAFPSQQWLHEGALMLRSTNITCLMFIGPCIILTSWINWTNLMSLYEIFLLLNMFRMLLHSSSGAGDCM